MGFSLSSRPGGSFSSEVYLFMPVDSYLSFHNILGGKQFVVIRLTVVMVGIISEEHVNLVNCCGFVKKASVNLIF